MSGKEDKPTTPVKAKGKKPSSKDDSASYAKTVGGRLKLKGVTKGSAKGQAEKKDDASKKLKDRIKKKSDRYAMNTMHDDED
ncbi:hypothetical protein PROFUN_01644 [Planoprotostelium fungivorum]|uniref:Uncharacterized protein n=1 Tax=Planoprotostelium fungivorum TaxID=1890364 RepID=A0A2P6NTU6_9EUKA|nr:hypothetical protein PROFUN_01644 [Planoprotostelium fungivorum]